MLKLKSDGLISACGIEEFIGGFAVISDDFNGIPLKEYFPDGYSGVIEFLDIAVQLAHTLGEIHHTDIIHKELKPNNIFINPETGRVKIVELGLLSILTSENDHIYEPEVLRDTLPYISPEQTGRMNRTVDYRTDFYSLGIIFYELLTGKVPFHSENPLELFYSHIEKAPESLSGIWPEIPGQVGRIIIKMLSKDPEERYQSGYGLKADLKECLHQLKRAGEIEPFPLGREDISDRLIIPQRIYGRDKEIDILMRAFERVRYGRYEIMLITGLAGIGKTVLVNEIRRPIVRHNGYFIYGKFDRLTKDKPYSAIVNAFTGLILQLFSENEERITRWKGLLNDALGNNGKIITDLIPELELLIGKQPWVQKLGIEQTKNRFNQVFRNFVAVFAKEERPLAIFIDDLQWIDTASLDLIKLITNDPAAMHILFIGAFRHNEVNASHPLMLWADEIERANTAFNQITLQPLEMASINQLVADTLKCDPHATEPLSELVYRKTSGNPFFVKQILATLFDDEMLSFFVESGWRWNIDGITDMQMPDDVVDMMSAIILKLSQGSQDILRFASCIGNRFDAEPLAKISGKSIDGMYSDLREMVDRGLLMTTKTGYKFSAQIPACRGGEITSAWRNGVHNKAL